MPQHAMPPACSLDDVTVVFQCPKLQHAGLSYNHVTSLPPAAVLQSSPILSLDLSHNDMGALRDATLSLAKLPQLANLSLAGNPLCLQPDYQHSVRTSLTRLLFHDGERLDSLSGSRPATVQRPGGGRGLSGPATHLEVTMSALSVDTNPFQPILDRWQQQIGEAEAANATVPPTLDMPALPMQPVYYHVDIMDPDGEALQPAGQTASVLGLLHTHAAVFGVLSDDLRWCAQPAAKPSMRGGAACFTRLFACRGGVQLHTAPGASPYPSGCGNPLRPKAQSCKGCSGRQGCDGRQQEGQASQRQGKAGGELRSWATRYYSVIASLRCLHMDPQAASLLLTLP